MGKGKGLISLAQGESGNNLGEMVNEDDAMESFTHDNNNLLSTPSSKNDESELVHKGSDDEWGTPAESSGTEAVEKEQITWKEKNFETH